MIIICGIVQTDPDKAPQLLSELRAGVDRTMREDGCLEYRFAVEDAARGRLMILERWRDEAALANHLGTAELQAFMAKWLPQISVEARKYECQAEMAIL